MLFLLAYLYVHYLIFCLWLMHMHMSYEYIFRNWLILQYVVASLLRNGCCHGNHSVLCLTR